MSNNQDRPDSEGASPEMRRAVSRRGFLTGELKTASAQAVKQLPAFGGIFGALLRESPAQRDERVVEQLWQLLTGRKPEPHENQAGLELVQKATTPDDKADALVDLLWALCRTRDFDELKRPDRVLVRGLYLIAQEREPSDAEKQAALDVIAEAVTSARACLEAERGDEAEGVGESAGEPQLTEDEAVFAARSGALEGLFTGLLRSPESVLRKSFTPPGRRSPFRRGV